MDIKAAFDTIKQDKMLQVVSDLLDKASYSSATHVPSPKLTAIGPRLLSHAVLPASPSSQQGISGIRPPDLQDPRPCQR
jgi:hypothetical protein